MKGEDHARERSNQWRALKAQGWSDAAIEHEKLSVAQWHVLKQVKQRFENWLKDKSWRVRLHRVEFLPHTQFLEIFVFYKTDADVVDGNADGVSEAIKQQMLSDLSDLEYPNLAATSIRFIFDSHENVVRNYEGSYFYRLR